MYYKSRLIIIDYVLNKATSIFKADQNSEEVLWPKRKYLQHKPK